MDYESLKIGAYKNKLAKRFNTIHVDKEIVLMTEELGELSDALMQNNREGIIDALGDITVYCLGLCGMFEWNANEVYTQSRAIPVKNYLPILVKELGWMAKTYKKSNKLPVWNIDKREDFKKHVGNLIKYCELAYVLLNEKKAFIEIVSSIIENNKTRHINI